MIINKGVTLVELLLVIAIIAIIGAATIPVGSAFLARSNLENKTNETVNTMRTAQLNTLSGKEDSQWGVNISSTQIILFKGATYATRDSSFDQAYGIPVSVTITQLERVFSRLTGNPNSTAVITLTAVTGDVNTVTVNEVGTVDVQ